MVVKKTLKICKNNLSEDELQRMTIKYNKQSLSLV